MRVTAAEAKRYLLAAGLSPTLVEKVTAAALVSTVTIPFSVTNELGITSTLYLVGSPELPETTVHRRGTQRGIRRNAPNRSILIRS